MAIFFSNSSPKIPKQSIFGPKFKAFLSFCKILQLGKFEGADMKYNNSVFEIL